MEVIVKNKKFTLSRDSKSGMYYTADRRYRIHRNFNFGNRPPTWDVCERTEEGKYAVINEFRRLDEALSCLTNMVNRA